jgi:hypothetical protein
MILYHKRLKEQKKEVEAFAAPLRIVIPGGN